MSPFDSAVARLRTYIPVGWTLLIAWLLVQVPWLQGVLDTLNIDPNSPGAQALVTAAVMGLFYEGVKRAQPWLNAHAPWLAQILIGSTLVPRYTTTVDSSALEAIADENSQSNDKETFPYVGE